MREYFFLFVISLILFGPNFAASKDREPTDPPWLAYGSLQGDLAPCGCDPRSDLGGVRRLATLVARERAAEPSLFLFDLGDQIDRQDRNPIKSRYLIQALDSLQPDAALLNKEELLALLSAHPDTDLLASRRPFVLSNVKTAISKSSSFLGLKNFSSQIVLSKGQVGTTLILGFVWDERLESQVLTWGPELRKSWESILASHRDAFSVLLFSGPDEVLTKIDESGLFAEIISSSSRDKRTEDRAVDAEKTNEDLLVRLSRQESAFNTKAIRMVPLEGKGVLRGGALRRNQALSLAAILKSEESSLESSTLNGLFQKESVTKKEESKFLTVPIQGFIKKDSNLIYVTWLTQDYEEVSPLKSLLETYTKETAEDFQKQQLKKREDLKSSPFAGAEACSSCHVQAAAVWKDSHHAKAYETLQKKQKNEDSDCVSCHVLGLQSRGGFISEQLTPQFKGVQCENCHGARAEHVKNPLKRDTAPGSLAAREVCLTCHRGNHSPSFQFDSYWQKIKHK
ncbi:MAG: hypothetical protein KA436_04580 [Oligoflexales bacterium]|nr:hypothetical protein [Oligoflexales bacterium]